MRKKTTRSTGDRQKIVVGYCRVSTDRQASEGVSLEAQETRIRAWAAAAGLPVAVVHVDAGLSGGRADNRPGLQRALAEVCEGGGVLVVYSLSRMARSTKDAIGISERLDRAGADLVSLSESIDTTTASGRMVFRMLAVLAEFERDLTAERTAAALAHKRRQGFRVSGRTPFGFDLDGGRLIPNESEIREISRMRELSGSGVSLRGIAKDLEGRGVPTKTGARWSAEVVRGVLAREVGA